MTKEDAIKMLESKMDGNTDTSYEWAETVRMAIKALEQETVSKEVYDNEHFARKEAEQKLWELQQNVSEDCVSRKELLKLYDNRAFELQKTHQTDKQLGINWCINTLNELPPVTPTHKSGLHWIERFNNEDKWLECPYCHKDSDNAYNYCPNCGVSFKADKRGNENDRN